MAMVIQFVLGAADLAYNQLEHYLWMLLLLALVVRGPGIRSLDTRSERCFGRSDA